MEQELQYFKTRIKEDFKGLPEENVQAKAMSLIKKRFRKSNGQWIPYEGIASSISAEEFYNLMKTKHTLQNRPNLKDVSMAAEERFNNFKYVAHLEAKAEIIDEGKTPEKFLETIAAADGKEFKNQKPNDFILLKSVLCTSLPYINKNGDAFKAEDLVDAVESGQMDKFQPAILDWNHDFNSLGNTIGAEVVDAEVEVEGSGPQKVKQIIVYSVFYSWLNQSKAKKVRQWAEQGILTFSMACGADDIEYINGYSNRVLRKPHFVANSIITPEKDPADRNAVIQTVALDKNEKGDTMNEDLKLLKEQVADLQAKISAGDSKEAGSLIESLSEKLFEQASTLIKERDDMEKELNEANENIEKMQEKIDTLEAENAKLIEEKDELKTASDAMAGDLSAKIDELKELRKSEVERINTERKEVLAGYISDEDKLTSWLNKYSASVTDEGKIEANQETFDEFVELLKIAVAKKEEVEVENEVKDSEKSELVKASEEDGEFVSKRYNDERTNKLNTKTI